MIFPLPPITMATSWKSWGESGSLARKETNLFLYSLTSDVHLWLLAACRQSVSPVNGEPLISSQRTYKPLTSRRQPHLTTYQLLVMQTLCGVLQARSGGLIHISAQLTLTIAIYFISLPCRFSCLSVHWSISRLPLCCSRALFVFFIDMIYCGNSELASDRRPAGPIVLHLLHLNPCASPELRGDFKLAATDTH